MMADSIRSWFLHLSPETRQRLLQNLLDHDQKWRVDYREGLAKKVESDMICMMDQLSELMEKEEPLFKGKMLQCGSSYNRTKVICLFSPWYKFLDHVISSCSVCIAACIEEVL